MAYEILFAEAVAEHLGHLTGGAGAGAGRRRAPARAAAPHRNAESQAAQAEPCRPMGVASRGLRVFYEVVSAQPPAVRVLAVGKKWGNVLRIGQQEIGL